MRDKRTILVVDDAPHIREIVRFAVEQAGYRAVEAADGRRALDQVAEHAPDLVVLDVLMPEMDGNDVCKRLRADGNPVPIIFLSSRDDEIDRILGLELGGDDYVTKPFSPRELLARMKAVFRRIDAAAGEPNDEPDEEAAEVGRAKLRLDLDGFGVFWGSAEIELTRTEFGILRTLARRPGKVYARSELMGDGIVSDRTIDSHVRHIREKFEAVGADPIETVHGIGYKLGACE